MKKIVGFIFLLGLISCASDQDKLGVKQCFEHYKLAVQEKDGAKAERLTTSDSKAYYEKIYDHIVHSDSQKVSSLNLLDQVLVLKSRMAFTGDELNQMKPNELFSALVVKGLIDNKMLDGVSLNKIGAVGSRCKATLVRSNIPLPFELGFKKENDEWKIDLTSILDEARVSLEEVAKRKGMSNKAFVEQFIGL